MQKWEYLVVRLEYTSGMFAGSGRAMARSMNEQELRDWKKTPLHSFMNQLGSEGWELVNAVGYPPGTTSNELLFKRPKP